MSTVRITATEKHQEPARAKQSFIGQMTNAWRSSISTVSETIKSLIIVVVYVVPWVILVAVPLLVLMRIVISRGRRVVEI